MPIAEMAPWSLREETSAGRVGEPANRRSSRPGPPHNAGPGALNIRHPYAQDWHRQPPHHGADQHLIDATVRRSLQRLAGRWRTAPAQLIPRFWIKGGGACGIRQARVEVGAGAQSERTASGEQPSLRQALDRPHADRSRSRTRTTGVGGQMGREQDQPSAYPLGSVTPLSSHGLCTWY